MTTTFLGRAAAEVFQSAKDLSDLQKLHIVLPSRRAALYFGRELASLSAIPFFAPKISSIDDFIQETSGLQLIKSVDLYFEIYKEWKQLDGSLTLEHFLTWVPTLVKDLNLIDSSLLDDTKGLFTYLDQADALKRWGINAENNVVTDFAGSYFSFFKKMGLVYHTLRERLAAKGVGYSGLLYRTAAEKAIDKEWKEDFYFIGLNALSTAEEVIIKHLVHIGKAKCIWDTDDYYMESKDKAGRKLRKYKSSRLFGKEWYFQESLLQGTEKHIQVYKLGSQVLQNKLAMDLVRKSSSSSHAVVILDEMDLPSIYTLVPGLDMKINISGGMSLKSSELMAAINLLLDISDQEKLRLEDLRMLMEQPLIRELVKGEVEWTKLERLAYKSTRLFYEREDLKMSQGSLWDEIVGMTEVGSFVRGVERILKTVEALEWNEKPFAQLVLKELPSVKRHLDVSKPAFRLLFQEFLKGLSLPFEKEPNAKVQIMSMLETRCLDFDEVTFLSFVEGKLPTANKSNSFLPFDAILEFKLPTYSDQDAIMAYHFYRLLQRAEKVNILYVQQGGSGVGRQEKSRFIYQIEEELCRDPKVDGKIKFSTTEINLGDLVKPKEITIPKTDEILEKAKDYFTNRGLSATALSEYFTSPLAFYWKYLEGIRENNMDEATIGANVFGTLIHYALEKADLPYVGKSITKEDLEAQKLWVIKNFDQLIQECKPEFDFSYGLNAVLKKVALDLLIKYYHMRIRTYTEPFTIVALEKKFRKILDIGGIKLKVEGAIDKLEKHGDTLVIIDYKTGKVEDVTYTHNPEVSFTEELKERKRDKFRQLLLYFFLIHSEEVPDAKYGFYSFRALNDRIDMEVKGLSKEELLSGIQGLIEEMVLEVLDKEKPFSAIEGRKVYENSTFSNLLN
ncbi:hypothetical protein Lbys_0997 [Leadbetterella byssophila DSM 17132]|uniref:PD-(D/E)XK endonuclease-like domain-containing protein n=1 Tax=Leadbetterella byssophila (strain DSM 17132 / JCM 16389 / KACC 11308 / NBRC 106382 / 4M15) TaxID=649349 RepID=E4RS75_LEAB4|nr:PD-(D/E)XK nuclease family protein [Leadbetterella byssophila]ADQ16727.1 hypothetical protein Lbys_0997 [Leadbetterella byssophila DSM 17132]